MLGEALEGLKVLELRRDENRGTAPVDAAADYATLVLRAADRHGASIEPQAQCRP